RLGGPRQITTERQMPKRCSLLRIFIWMLVLASCEAASAQQADTGAPPVPGLPRGDPVNPSPRPEYRIAPEYFVVEEEVTSAGASGSPPPSCDTPCADCASRFCYRNRVGVRICEQSTYRGCEFAATLCKRKNREQREDCTGVVGYREWVNVLQQARANGTLRDYKHCRQEARNWSLLAPFGPDATGYFGADLCS